jgi:hypothetical protein
LVLKRPFRFWLNSVNFNKERINKMKKYSFGNETVEAPESMDVEDVRNLLAEILPGVENAVAETQPDGSVQFVVRAGNKG